MLYPRYEKDHARKSNSREKAAKWTNMAAKQVTEQQQSLQHSPDLDPTAPITSNIPPREASREPQHWVKCANMEKDMPQECTTIAEDWHKRAPILTTHWSKLASTRRLKRAPTSGEMRQYGKGYAPRMHQDRRRLAQMCPNFDHPLEQACTSNKNDKKLSKPTFLHLSDLIFHGTE